MIGLSRGCGVDIRTNRKRRWTSSVMGQVMTKYETKALDGDAWPDFARLVDANNGVWGGCWCMWYHAVW